VEEVLGDQGAHGAQIDHVPGPGMIEQLVLRDPDVGAVAPLGHVEHRLLCHVFHEPHTSGAEDATIGHVEHVATEVLHRTVPLGIFGVAGAGPPFLEHVVLKLALAGLIADRAVERVIDEEQLENSLARLLRLVAIHMHHLPLSHRSDTRGHELGRLLYFDQAHPAYRRRGKRRVVAVMGHEDAGLLGGLDDGGALGDTHRHSVDSYGYEFFSHFIPNVVSRV
jgi:hypothetical protein